MLDMVARRVAHHVLLQRRESWREGERRQLGHLRYQSRRNRKAAANARTINRTRRLVAPDGSRIIFSFDRDGTKDLYRMTADGRDVTRLTDTTGVEVLNAWLPDGRLLMAHYEPEAPLGHWYLADERDRPLASLPCLYGALDPVAYIPD